MSDSVNKDRGNLLCVANFPTDAGYAWRFIEELYGAVADELARFGIDTWVAYPKILESPAGLQGSRAHLLELDVRLDSPKQVLRLIRAIRRRNVRILYLTDRPFWHPVYALLRVAGVRRLVVHDHSSGRRSPTRGFRGFVKRIVYRLRWARADSVLAVSEFVRRRAIEVDLVPGDRVHLLLNSIKLASTGGEAGSLRRRWGLSSERPLIVCAARAAKYKGVQHLLRAFELVHSTVSPTPALLYFGEGPFMDELVQLKEGLSAGDDVIFAGYHDNVAEMIADADIAVVPSTWAEAFGLAALEPAAHGVAVVASRVGGIPEVVVDGVTGLLVPPGDPEELAAALEELLTDPERRRQMGEKARERARTRFSRTRQMELLKRFFRRQFGVDGNSTHPSTAH